MKPARLWIPLRIPGRSAAAAAALTLGAAAVAAATAAPPAAAVNHNDLLRLLEQRECPRCDLAGADLVHARLEDVDLRQARLQRANLGQARLDGARLSGADLSFTTLQGASLRGADLRGTRLEGTDLRQADLSGTLLDPGALARAHWQGARGMEHGQLSFGELHNAGVLAAQQGRYPEAEGYFSSAIRSEPSAAVSWVARGITRSELGKTQLAASDFEYAASLYAAGGEQAQADQLRLAASQVTASPDKAGSGGNGLGSALVGGAMGGAMGALQFLLPLAAKAFMPLPF